jgi:hypothetical protein
MVEKLIRLEALRYVLNLSKQIGRAERVDNNEDGRLYQRANSMTTKIDL